MTTRTYTTKSGTTFEWEETPDVLEYIKQLHQTHVSNTTGRRQDSQKESKES
jgi:uncharacterized protein YqgV (UPF0045/DUF77 family)